MQSAFEKNENENYQNFGEECEKNDTTKLTRNKNLFSGFYSAKLKI